MRKLNLLSAKKKSISEPHEVRQADADVPQLDSRSDSSGSDLRTDGPAADEHERERAIPHRPPSAKFKPISELDQSLRLSKGVAPSSQ